MKRYVHRAKEQRPRGAVPAAVRELVTLAGSRFLKGVNRAGRVALDDGRKIVSLSRGRLLEKARRITGLDDFGPDPFLVPLDILLRSFEEDADLNLIGRITVQREMLRLLCNRLCLERDRRHNPDIGRERIRQPMFITGLPRSGTTFLHALLAQDPGCRAPLVWEAMHPSPPPECETHRTDPRIALTRRELAWIDVLMPRFHACHCIDACLPQECIALMDHSFLSYLFESMYYVTSYRSWHDAQDKRPAYLYHRRFLQQLQWRCPGTHWVLKAPSHMMALETLLEVYPDAQIVMTHRDPLKVLPSCASFAEVLRSPFTGSVDPCALGAEVSRRWADSATAAVRLRSDQRKCKGHFLDVQYADLVRDPMGVVRNIYRFFDRDLTREAQECMRLFIVNEPKGKMGVHSYTLGQFGLDPVEEREKFKGYCSYFDVAPER